MVHSHRSFELSSILALFWGKKSIFPPIMLQFPVFIFLVFHTPLFSCHFCCRFFAPPFLATMFSFFTSFFTHYHYDLALRTATHHFQTSTCPSVTRKTTTRDSTCIRKIRAPLLRDRWICFGKFCEKNIKKLCLPDSFFCLLRARIPLFPVYKISVFDSFFCLFVSAPQILPNLLFIFEFMVWEIPLLGQHVVFFLKKKLYLFTKTLDIYIGKFNRVVSLVMVH